MTGDTTLTIGHLLVERKRRRVLRVDSLSFGLGCTVLAGANGSGKSTFVEALAGLVPWTGEVRIGDTPIAAGRTSDKIGYLPQVPLGITHLTTHEAACFTHSLTTRSRRVKGTSSEVDSLLNRLGINHLRDIRIGQMSGGERQLAYLAAVLAQRPSVLLLDEPTVGLDAVHRSLLYGIVRTLAADTAIVLTSHLVEDIAQLGEDIVVLHSGEVSFVGTVDEFARTSEPTLSRSAAIDAALINIARSGSEVRGADTAGPGW
jgi:ABC-type multidrug transport system ATPase subunit